MSSDNDSAEFHWSQVFTHLNRFVDALSDDEVDQYCSKYDEPGDDEFDETVSELIGALRDALEIRWLRMKEES